MKKLCLALVFCALASLPAAAEEAPFFYAGGGFEDSGYALRGRSVGLHIEAGYAFMPGLQAGLRAAFFHDFISMPAVEWGATVRYTFIDLSTAEAPGLSFFVDGLAGMSHIFYEGQTAHSAFAGAVGLGLSVPAGPWFCEIFLRGGYPFLWSAGASVGYRFGNLPWGNKTAGETK